MNFVIKAAFLAALVSCLCDARAEDSPDVVKSLPGYDGALPFTHYSGYVPVDDKYNSKMWYFFTEFSGEEYKDGKNAPLIVWLNGGPGCSSTVAVFHEHGAYVLNDDATLSVNEHSWHHSGHVLYLDNPVGVGMSFLYNEDAYVTTEQQVAEAIHGAVSHFLKAHPEYASSDVYLAGESYAGKYILHTASYLQKCKTCAFKLTGAAIGDGLVDPQSQRFVYPRQVYANALLSGHQTSQLEAVNDHCRQDIKMGHFAEASESCDRIMTFIQTVTGDLNPYDLRKYGKPYNKPGLVAYLNTKEFREAVHVTEFEYKLTDTCNGTVSSRLSADRMETAVPLIAPLLTSGFRLMFYNGQFDLKDGPIGTQEYLEAVHWPGQEAFRTAPRAVWRVGNAVAGYAREEKNLRFVTINGAGHFAPMDQRAATLDMMSKFVANTPITKWEGATVPDVCELLKDCSGHGKCSERGCVCDAGHTGADCSYKLAKNVELGVRYQHSLEPEEWVFVEFVANRDEVADEMAVISVLTDGDASLAAYVAHDSLPSETNFAAATKGISHHTRIEVPWHGKVTVGLVNRGHGTTLLAVSLRGAVDLNYAHSLWAFLLIAVPVFFCVTACLFVMLRFCCVMALRDADRYSDKSAGSLFIDSDASTPFVGTGPSLPAGAAEGAAWTVTVGETAGEEASSPLAMPVSGAYVFKSPSGRGRPHSSEYTPLGWGSQA